MFQEFHRERRAQARASLSDYVDIRKDFAECALQPGGVYLIVQPQLRHGMLALRDADGDGALLPHVSALCF